VEDHSTESDVANALTAERRSPEDLVEFLVRLSNERFGGASRGKYRVSRKFLRQLAGRRKLSDEYLSALAEEMFEAGFVFVNCESYYIVLSQKQFVSYRRVTALALNRVMSHEEANNEPKIERGKESAQTDAEKIREKPHQETADIL
jgi:hypothetical protein